MRTRILIHYASGMTWRGNWDETVDFKTINHNNTIISSLEIQEEGGRSHTLSLKRKQLNAFWQRDSRHRDKLMERTILRRLSKNIWLELNLDCITGGRRITIIREDIKVK